jgi:uncharacterized protein YndB with AHSA1/START domain
VNSSTDAGDHADRIVTQIVIKASAERVFDALTDPLQRVKWWQAPGKFAVTQVESDPRPDGAWLMRGTGPEGKPFTMSGEYTKVERPRLLEFTWQPDWPEPQTLVRFDLDEQHGMTTVRLTHSGFANAAGRDRYQGWPWLLALLQQHVETQAAGSTT